MRTFLKLLSAFTALAFTALAFTTCGNNTPTKYADLPGQAATITPLAFSPDNKLLASGDTLGTLKLWNYVAQTELASANTGQAISLLRFSPDSSLLALASSNNKTILTTTLELWQVNPLQRLHSFDARVSAICFTPDNSTFLTGSPGGSLQQYDAKTAKLLHQWPIGRPILAIAVSPDNSLAAVGTQPDPLRKILGKGLSITNANKLAVPNHSSIEKEPGGLFTVYLEPFDTFISLIDLKNPQAPLRSIPGNDNATTALKFSADGHTLFAGGTNKFIRQLSTITWKEERLITLESEYQNIQFADDAEWFSANYSYTGFGDKYHYVLTIAELRGPSSFRIEDGDLCSRASIALSPTAKTLAIAPTNISNPIQLWTHP